MSPFAVMFVSGCAVATPSYSAAPSVAMFDSFFPSWLICLLVAVVAAVILRVVFVAIGLDDVLQARVPVYMALALGLTFLFSYMFFGR